MEDYTSVTGFIASFTIVIVLSITFSSLWFHLSIYINVHNYRIWSSTNSHIYQEASFHPRKVGIWCAMTAVASKLYLKQVVQLMCFVVLPHNMDKRSASVSKYIRYSNMYSYQTMGKVDTLLGWTLLKIRITSKKASNKSCSELNLIQKSPRVHMSIYSPWSKDRGLERLACSKYYYIGKQQITYKLGLNAAKNMDHIKKSFK